MDLDAGCTKRTLEAIDYARSQAGAMGDPGAGTEHLLLGLLHDPTAFAAQTLTERLGVSAEGVREQVVRRSKRKRVPRGAVWTPDGARALARAGEQAAALGDDYIGTEHILLAVVRDPESPGARILHDLGAPPDKVRAAVRDALTEHARHVAEPAVSPPVPAERLEAVPTHADRPAQEDALGRIRLAEVVAERMRRISRRGHRATR